MKLDTQRTIPLAHIAEFAYPPMDLAPQSLKQLYLDISEVHNYTEFKLLEGNNGAQFAIGNKRQFSILRERLVVKDDFTEETFESFKNTTLDLVERTRTTLKIPVFLTQNIIIRQLLPTTSDKPAAEDLMRTFFRLEREALQEFKRPLSGVGVRFVFPPTQQDASEFQLRIEPYFRDPQMIFVENAARFLQPRPKQEDLAAIMQRAYDFLHEETARFLERGSED